MSYAGQRLASTEAKLGNLLRKSNGHPWFDVILDYTMQYNLLGKTGLYVSELCLGTMTFGGQGMWAKMGRLNLDEVSELVKKAFDSGINFIDTANVYSLGESESLTGAAIRKLGLPRDQLVIATKATGVMNDLPNGRGQSRYHLMNEIDASLKRLQVDHI